MLFVGTSIIHPSTEGVFLLCNILDLLIYSYKIGSILIGKNVWIGANVTILKNSVIGDNCVIGAGSVVKGKYHSNTLVVGNPAVEKKGDMTVIHIILEVFR